MLESRYSRVTPGTSKSRACVVDDLRDALHTGFGTSKMCKVFTADLFAHTHTHVAPHTHTHTFTQLFCSKVNSLFLYFSVRNVRLIAFNDIGVCGLRVSFTVRLWAVAKSIASEFREVLIVVMAPLFLISRLDWVTTCSFL